MQDIFKGLGREVELAPIAALHLYENNARVHKLKQIKKLAGSIQATGWAAPIIVDEKNMILAGAGRYAAAQYLKLNHVPVVRLYGLADAQKRAYILADNRLGDESAFDKKTLKIELKSLAKAGLDLRIAGFDSLESDRILSLDDADASADEEEIELPGPNAQPVSRPGDLWHIGPHRQIVGDSRNPLVVERVLAGQRVPLFFADPPFGCRIAGNVSGLGKVKHKDFLVGAGETSLAEFGQTLLRPALRCMAVHAMPGALAFICTDWRASPYLHDAAQGVFLKQLNLIVWAKTNAGMGTTYRSAHELIHLYKVSVGEHINNFGLGEGGRHRSNLWQYAGANTFRKGRMEDLSAHSTVKPKKLVADAIIDCSRRGDLILDCFAGSGTTLSAADSVGRRGYGIEIDPQYADVILRRVSKATGQPALLDGTTPFEEVEAARNPHSADAS